MIRLVCLIVCWYQRKMNETCYGYARKGYEIVVQRMALCGLSWAAFGYREDRAP